MREFIKRAFRYCLVGGIASIIDYGAYMLVVWLINSKDSLSLCLASTVGFILGLAVNYLLSLIIVWRVKKSDKRGKSLVDILVFIGTGLAGLFLSWAVIGICTDWLCLPYWFSKLAAMALVLAWNFVSREFLIFNKKGSV